MLRSTNYAAPFFRLSMSAQTKFRQVFRTTCKRLTLLVLSFSSTFVATPANIPTSQSTARINNRSAVRVVNPLAVRLVRSCTFVCLKYLMYESINTSFPHVEPSHKGKPDIIEVVPSGAFFRPCFKRLTPVGLFSVCRPSLTRLGLYRLLIMIYFCTPYLIVIIRYTTYQ